MAVQFCEGNHDTHLVLRGGSNGPNHGQDAVREAAAILQRALRAREEHGDLLACTGKEPRLHHVATKLVVDCSHGNSCKDYRQQPVVARDVASRLRLLSADTDNSGDDVGDHAIAGVMLESFLKAGKQTLEVHPHPHHSSHTHSGSHPKDQLQYGMSITDGCIDVDTTVAVLEDLASAASSRAR